MGADSDPGRLAYSSIFYLNNHYSTLVGWEAYPKKGGVEEWALLGEMFP